jgi:hypothetical protein
MLEMKINELFHLWDKTASGALTEKTYTLRLSIEDAARLAALSEMYPKRTSEQLIRDLLSAALNDLECAMPYIKGKKIISEDEMGDPCYEDLGSTPTFIRLSQKHLALLKK